MKNTTYIPLSRNELFQLIMVEIPPFGLNGLNETSSLGNMSTCFFIIYDDAKQQLQVDICAYLSK